MSNRKGSACETWGSAATASEKPMARSDEVDNVIGSDGWFLGMIRGVGKRSLPRRAVQKVMCLDMVGHPRVSAIHGPEAGVGGGLFAVPDMTVFWRRRIKAGAVEGIGKFARDFNEPVRCFRRGHGREIELHQGGGKCDGRLVRGKFHRLADVFGGSEAVAGRKRRTVGWCGFVRLGPCSGGMPADRRCSGDPFA